MFNLGGIFATLGIRDTAFARAIDTNKWRLLSLGSAASKAGQDGAHGLKALTLAAGFIPGPVGAAARAANLASGAFSMMGKGIDGVTAAAKSAMELQKFQEMFSLGGLTAGIKAAEDSAVQYESSLVKLMKASNLTGSEFAGLRGELEKLAGESKGVSLGSIMDIATMLAKVGTPTDQLREQTAQLIMVAKAADDVPVEELVDRLGKIQSVAKLGSTGFLQLGASIDKLADTGISSFDAISRTAARSIGTAQAVGVSTQELLGMATALLETGAMPEMAGTGLNKLMGLASGDDTRKAIGDILKVDGDELERQLEKPFEALMRLMDALKEMTIVQRSAALDSLKMSGVEDVAMINNMMAVTERVRQARDQANEQFRNPTQALESSRLVDETELAKRQQALNQIEVEMNRLGGEFSGLGTRINETAAKTKLALMEIAREATGDGPTLAQWAATFERGLEMLVPPMLTVVGLFAELVGHINAGAAGMITFGSNTISFTDKAIKTFELGSTIVGEFVGNLISGGEGMTQANWLADRIMGRVPTAPKGLMDPKAAKIAAEANAAANDQEAARAAKVAEEQAKAAAEQAKDAEDRRAREWISGVRSGMREIAADVGGVLRVAESSTVRRIEGVAGMAGQALAGMIQANQDRQAIMGAPGRTMASSDLARALQEAIGDESQRVAERQLQTQERQLMQLRDMSRTLRDVSNALRRGITTVLG